MKLGHSTNSKSQMFIVLGMPMIVTRLIYMIQPINIKLNIKNISTGCYNLLAQLSSVFSIYCNCASLTTVTVNETNRLLSVCSGVLMPWKQLGRKWRRFWKIRVWLLTPVTPHWALPGTSWTTCLFWVRFPMDHLKTQVTCDCNLVLPSWNMIHCGDALFF